MPRPSTGLNTVSKRRPDGSVETYWYHRRTGLLIGRSSTGWTKDAAIARAREIDDQAPSGPAAGTFNALVTLYLASPAFLSRAPKTRREYQAHLDYLRDDCGWSPLPIGAITRMAVRTMHQAFEGRPHQGNAIVRTLRAVLNHGIHDLEMPGLVKNPAARMALYDTPPRTEIWDQPRIDAFLDAASPTLRLAFALLLYTVQRPSDVLLMTRPQLLERDGRTWISLRQQKTGALLDVPCHSRLKAELKAASSAPAALSTRKGAVRAPNLVVNAHGKPWTYRRFAQAWDKARRTANWSIMRAAIAAQGGLPRAVPERAAAKATIRARLLTDLQRRDLRRTGVVQLALSGATTPEIAAQAGWKIDYTQRIIDTYLPRNSRVALGGIEKWEDSVEKVVVLARRRD